MFRRSRRAARRLSVLVVAFGLGAFVQVAPAEAHRPSAPPGCQLGRRTVVHAAGAARASASDGSYVPCVVDTGMTSGESGLAISRDGTLIRSAATNPLGIAVSHDDGATWQRQPLPSSVSSFIADGYLDPVTDRYFYSSAGAAPVLSSDDQGRTWQAGTFDSVERQDWNKVFSGPPVAGRASGYPTNTYYCNWTTPLGITSQTRCFKSIDGGHAFTWTGSDPYADAVCHDPNQTTGNGHGRGVVDARDGTIYLPVEYCGSLEVAISHDEGATWTRTAIVTGKSSALQTLIDAFSNGAWYQQLFRGRFNLPPELSSGQNGDALAIDARGRLWAVWIDGTTYLPRLARSDDGGRTWSTPIDFSPPGVQQAVLPSVAVAPDGRVGIAYYATTDKWNWTGYLTVADSGRGRTPTFESAAVTPPGQPLMPEPCCWASGPQEYSAARWAPDGSLWGAFAGSTTSPIDARGVLGRLVRARR